MANTIKLPSGVEVYEGKSVRIPGMGTVVPVGDLTPAEVQALRDDVASVMDMSLDDLADVNAADPDDGYVLAWDGDDWSPAPIQSGISRVGLRGVVIHPGAGSLDFWTGFTVEEFSAEWARVRLDFSGSGTSERPARVDHTHTQPLPVRVTTAPSGYISGGSQPLGSTSVTLTNGIAYVVEAELYGQFRGADSGAAYYTLSITIAGNTYTSPGGESGFWCVQGVPDKINWQHERKITGTGASVPVSASVAWHSGSGFNIDRTYLKVRVRPER